MSYVSLISFYALVYPIGILIGLWFWSWKVLGFLKVEGFENFPKHTRRILVISNHPTLVEPILLIGLFFHKYLFRPRLGPWVMADRINYVEKYPFLKSRLISIDRTKKVDVDNTGSLNEAKEVLNSGGNLIVFPEGGRTHKGTHFLVSKKGKKVRVLKKGFAYLALDTRAKILPIWFEYDSLFKMRLVIGQLDCFINKEPKEVLRWAEESLLSLADSL